MSLAGRYEETRLRVAEAAKVAGRKPEDVLILAVTKSVAAEKIREVFNLGLRDFAENYAQEASTKMESLEDLPIRWHFIGQIQSNKIKMIAGRFDLVHSLSRMSVAEELAKRSDRVQDVLVEVNLAGENSKGGCSVERLPEILEGVQNLGRLRLRGLMFMAPLDISIAEQRRYYSRARELRDSLTRRLSGPHSLRELSMGTSHDFEVAVQEGATIVRLGTVIFGERPYGGT